MVSKLYNTEADRILLHSPIET